MEQLLFPLAAVYDPPINMDLTKPSLLLLLLLVPTSTSYLFFYCSGRIFFDRKIGPSWFGGNRREDCF